MSSGRTCTGSVGIRSAIALACLILRCLHDLHGALLPGLDYVASFLAKSESRPHSY